MKESELFTTDISEEDRTDILGEDWTEIKSINISTFDDVQYGRLHRYINEEVSGYLSSATPRNLGLYITSDKYGENKKLHSAQYIGVMPIVPIKGEKEAPIIWEKNIIIYPRFALNPNEMLNTVLESNDFLANPSMLSYKLYTMRELQELEYKNDIQRKKILFGKIRGGKKIDLSEISGTDSENKKIAELTKVYDAFEIVDFIQKAKIVCRKHLKQSTIKVEENLNSKIKGRILVQKQIKYNESRGQLQKVYCSYNAMSESIRENEILKYTLYLCEHYKKSKIAEAFSEDIQFCKRCLSDIPLVKCTKSSFAGLKNNAAYRDYKDALEAAKRIIFNMGIKLNKDVNKSVETERKNNIIDPFFIDMQYLFELYCRALVEKAIEAIEKEESDKLNKKMMLENQKKAKKALFNEYNKNNPYMESYIPDIVIVDSNEKVLVVLDAKYSKIASSNSKRERTHQVCFYMLVLDCKYGGLIGVNDEKNTGQLNTYELLQNEKKSNFKLLSLELNQNANLDDHKKQVQDHIEQVQNLLKEIVEKENDNYGRESEQK